VLAFGSVRVNSFDYWIALDTNALRACHAIPRYDRGHYGQQLPEFVCLVDGLEEFETVAALVWQAFCESS